MRVVLAVALVTLVACRGRGEANIEQHELPFTLEWDPQLQISVGPVFDVPLSPDVVSFSATVDVPGESTGFGLVDFGGVTWIDGSLFDGPGAWYTEPYFHWALLGGTIVAPITPETSPVGADLLSLQPAALNNLDGVQGTLRVLVRNETKSEPESLVDIHVGLVGGTSIDLADLDVALAKAGEIWSAGGGPGIGEVTFVEVEGDALLRYADSTELRRQVLDAGNPYAINLFIIQDYADAGGTLGEAGGIPGPVGLQGVDEAGVIVSIDGHRLFDGSLDLALMGGTIAHEIGHQFGLFHTTESDGSRLETLDDTPDCAPSADTDGDGWFTAEECEAWDGPNFMFWASGNFVQEDVSATQGWVVDSSVVVR